MGSSIPDDSSQKAIEGDLFETGEKLLKFASSTDELLSTLDKAESLLAKVWQRPPVSTCVALLPAMKALIADEILRHNDLNVQVAVASCFNELTRITCPDPPYDDEMMMVFFRLVMIAFKQLSCESGQNYSRAVMIIETMAKVRSFLMLLDIDNDGLIVKMFEVFLSNIKSSQSSDVFKYMESIMTMVIQESDDISTELLRPLLASVKMANKNTKPISWELGRKVFENCATKLPSYLREAVKEMNLQFADYAVIVTSICRFISKETSPNGKNTVSKNVSPSVNDRASQLDGHSEGLRDGNGNKSKDKSSSETLKDDQSILQSKTNSRKKRGRRPNSVIRPEEGYQHVWTSGDKYFGEASSDSYNEEKNDLPFVLALGNVSDSSRKRNYSSNDGSSHQKGQSKKSMVNEKKNKENISRNKMQMEDSSMSKPAKSKHPRKDNEMKSKKSGVDYGDKLVGLRIQVWWPMDETFYAGTVTAFDPETKKHTILYYDDETEVLNLRKETWELCADEQPVQDQEADNLSPPSPAQQLVKIPQKTTKRRPVSLKHGTSSAKRPKSENRKAIKSVEISALMNDESDNETRETNVGPKDGDGENHALNEKSEMIENIMETGTCDVAEDVTND